VQVPQDGENGCAESAAYPPAVHPPSALSALLLPQSLAYLEARCPAALFELRGHGSNCRAVLVEPVDDHKVSHTRLEFDSAAPPNGDVSLTDDVPRSHVDSAHTKPAKSQDEDQHVKHESAEELESLRPKSKVHFANLALGMNFRPDALCEGIEQFARAVLMSELPADSDWLYEKLIEKITAVSPGALKALSTRFSVSISKQDTFEETIQQLQDSLSFLQVNDLTRACQGNGTEMPSKDVLSRTKRDRSVRDFASEKHPRAWQDRHGDGCRIDGDRRRQAPGPDQRQKRDRQKEWRRLALRFDRCFRCGMHAPNLSKHEADQCRPDPQAFSRRMGVVKSLVDKGQDGRVNQYPSFGKH
jgi:hypothetical protein